MLDNLLQINAWVMALIGGPILVIVLKSGNAIIKYFVTKTKLAKEKDEGLIEMKGLLEELAADNVEIKSTLRVHKRSNVSILHDKVYRNCREYLKAGYVTVEQLDNLEYLYNSYKEQDGNGTGDNLYNRVMELPIKD